MAKRTTKNTSWFWIIKMLLIKLFNMILLIILFILRKIWILTLRLLGVIGKKIQWRIKCILYKFNNWSYDFFGLAEVLSAEVQDTIQNDNFVALNRHEIRFKKTEEFDRRWKDFDRFLIFLDIGESEKMEMIEYMKILVTEAERGAFNICFEYLKNKKDLIPSYENMLLEKAIEKKKDEGSYMWTVYDTSYVDKLKSRRESEYEDARYEQMRKNGVIL